jgi:hemolysin III
MPRSAGSRAAAAAVQTGPVGELVAAVRPRLRGWLHVGTAPAALVSGLVLVALATDTAARVGSLVFAVTAVLLFGTSAVYHRGRWSARAHAVLKRLDHSNIFLIIAGTYTPLALCLLPPEQSRTLLAVVWAGALVGVLFRVLWVEAPRWLTTPAYLALGWVAVFYFRPLLHGGGPVIMSLIVAGGLLYTFGAVVYGTRRPDPSPRWFGFHEVFHACTVAAFVVHSVAVSFAAYGVTPGAVAASS